LSKLKLGFLGPPQISHAQWGDITLPNRKSFALLAFLAVESASAHSRESLFGLLWPESPTSAAQNNLRVTWSMLRKFLKEAPSEQEPFLLSTRLELQFNLHSDHWLDVTAFERLLEDCQTHGHSEQQICSECAARLEKAAVLVRGEFLGGFTLGDCPAFDEWVLIHRERLHLQITEVLRELAGFHERSGNLARSEGYVRHLLEFDPLAEGAHRQLMRLLSEMGRRSAALAQFEICQRWLADELGVAPAAETTLLAERIRALAPGQPTERRHNLPASTSRFYGRKDEINTLQELLTSQVTVLVTLTGPGGVGKTRLAVQVASGLVDHFSDGVWFVELSELVDPQAIPSAVAKVLSAMEETDRALMQTLSNNLHDKSLLLVLDNCEHLLEACTQFVKSLRASAQGLVVLVTSRAPLRLDGERVVRLQPLPLPDIDEEINVAKALKYEAVQLFTNRAAKANLNFRLTEETAPFAAQICRNLDGMPMAIELAAARSGKMPIEAIAQRLDQRFRWLNAQYSGSTSRQRTLHTMIDWSHDLLDASERSLFHQLSVFTGGWTLEAAEAICTQGELCLDTLTELVDQSLVEFGYDNGNRRYRMHETIRQYARQELRADGDESEVFERHARYFAGLVTEAVENVQGQPLGERLDIIEEEHDNLRAAFNWLVAYDRELALTIVANLGIDLKFWEMRGHFEEGRRWLRCILEPTTDLISTSRAYALLAAADLSSAITDFDYGQACALQSQQLFHELDHPQGVVEAKLVLAGIADLSGDQLLLETTVLEAIALSNEIHYQPGLAEGRWLMGGRAYEQGNFDQAIQYLLPSLALWREINNPWKLARVLNTLAACLMEKGDFAEASEILQETAEINEILGYRRGVALALHNLGETAMCLGDYSRAKELNSESLKIRRELGLRRGYAFSFENFALLAAREKQFTRAVQLFAAAKSLRETIGAPGDRSAQEEYANLLTEMRAELGEIHFELEWSKGSSMSTDQALEFALNIPQ